MIDRLLGSVIPEILVGTEQKRKRNSLEIFSLSLSLFVLWTHTANNTTNSFTNNDLAFVTYFFNRSTYLHDFFEEEEETDFRNTMRPFVRSYGEISTVTSSPTMTRMEYFLSLPPA